MAASVFTSPILQVLLARLRANYVDPAAFTDDDILAMLNDAYADVCASTRCLKNLTTITTLTDVPEYALPGDFDEAVCVVTAGVQLDPVPIDDALADFVQDGIVVGYYVYGTVFGVVPTPSADTAPIMLLYSAKPAAFVNYDSVFDPRFPVEFADLLLHWVRWRSQMIAGGAERIGSAMVDRQIYDLRLKEMRRVVDTIPRTSNAMLSHVQQGARKLIGS